MGQLHEILDADRALHARVTELRRQARCRHIDSQCSQLGRPCLCQCKVCREIRGTDGEDTP